MQQPGGDNTIFNTAADFINNSNHPVFLTGKAGTGKTTFLKFIKENTRKNTVIVAPTGVAAINAGGTTIHSFFQLPFGPYLPLTHEHFTQQNAADKNSLLGNLKLSAERREIMELLELLIIDEISMVRCDVLDAIDAVLRHVRKQYSKPFGGVQVLYIGDMYQLPPVIKDEEWKILSKAYANPFFFNSHVVAEQFPVYIELKKVYRQTDATFISLLNQVRNNEMDEDGYNLLHSRFVPGYKPAESDHYITLTTHNNKADAINAEALSQIHERNYSFTAGIEGSFFESSFPADEVLNIKTGAQVMFLRNDTEKVRRYFNGKIGLVKHVEEDKIWVECEQDGSVQLIEVKREIWRNIKYSLNSKTNRVEEEELGSFTQYPLRLAWAITIHKSQGLTFQNVIIDAGSAFAPGQVYVALSRCTSLEGIILHSRITYNSLRSDDRVVDFANKQQDDTFREQLLLNAAIKYQQEIIFSLFDFRTLQSLLTDFSSWINQNNIFGPAVGPWLSSIKTNVDIFINYSEKFSVVLNEFFLQEGLPVENELFQQRFKKAADWFFLELDKTKKEFLKSPAITDNKQLAKDYNAKAQNIFELLCLQLHLLNMTDFSLPAHVSQKVSFRKEAFPVNAYAGKSVFVAQDIQHPRLYNELKEKRNEIAEEKDIPIYMVCKTQSLEEMSRFLPCNKEQLALINGFGAVKIKQYGTEFIKIIQAYCELNNLENNLFTAAITTPKRQKKAKPVVAAKPDTKRVSFDLFKAGKSPAEIASERNLALSTIEGHLANFIETGELDINTVIEEKKQSKILEIINASEDRSLSYLKTQMPFASFGEIRWVLASVRKEAIRVE